MASIGDLIMRVVAETKGFATQVINDAEKAGDKAGKGFSQRFAKASKAASGGKSALLQGLGLGVGLGVIGAATAAVGGLADAIGSATKAAIADEESQSRLKQSLKANVAGWDDNTDAIEKTIAAQQRKGFDDEQQRDALTVLVGATHDVAKAQEIMATAMDLARFKGISLVTASEALIKVEGGMYRSLKQLGIKLKEGATSEDALAAVREVASGQAEAYANTLGGKLLANQIRFSEVMEDFGRSVLPLVADGLELVTNAADLLGGVTRDNIEGLERETADLYNQGGTAEQVANLLDRVARAKEAALRNPLTSASEQESLNRSLNTLRQFYGALEHTGQVSSGLQGNLKDMGRGLIALTHDTDTSAVAFKNWSSRVIESSAEVRRRLTNDMDALIDDVFDEEINRDRLAAQNAEIAAAKRILASGKASAAEKRDARATLHSVAKDREQTLQELATHGDLSQKEIAKHLKDLKRDYKNSTGDARIRIGKLIDKWKELQRLGNKPITLTVATQLITANAAKPRGGHRAAGGPVRANVPYVVNERTRNSEVFTPSASGAVLTVAQAMKAMQPSGGGDTFQVNVGKADISTVHEIVWEQRRLAATRSMLPRALRR